MAGIRDALVRIGNSKLVHRYFPYLSRTKKANISANIDKAGCCSTVRNKVRICEVGGYLFPTLSSCLTPKIPEEVIDWPHRRVRWRRRVGAAGYLHSMKLILV